MFVKVLGWILILFLILVEGYMLVGLVQRTSTDMGSDLLGIGLIGGQIYFNFKVVRKMKG